MKILFRYIGVQITKSFIALACGFIVLSIYQVFNKYDDLSIYGFVSIFELGQIIVYNLPLLLILLLPLSAFLAFILVLGRMQERQEYIMLQIAGISEMRILWHALAWAGGVAILVFLLVNFLSPWGLQQTDNILSNSTKRTNILQHKAGKFLNTPKIVFYSDKKQGKDRVNNIFLYNRKDGSYVFANYAEVHADHDRLYLKLKNGAYFTPPDSPNNLDWNIVQFEEYQQLLRHLGLTGEVKRNKYPQRRQTLIDLIGLVQAQDKQAMVEIAYRMSWVFLPLLITPFALLFASNNPRLSRHLSLIPALLLYGMYVFVIRFAYDQAQHSFNQGLLSLLGAHMTVIGGSVFLLHRRWRRS